MVPGRQQILVHLQRVVFVVAGRNPTRGPQQPLVIRVGIHGAQVGNVVPGLLHPESKRKFPQQKRPRTLRQVFLLRSPEFLLPVLAVRPDETDADFGADVPWMTWAAIVVHGPVVGPAIVRLPGSITTLKEKITGPIVADDEDDITLQLVAFGGQLAQVNTAGPVLRNGQRRGGLPATPPQAFEAHPRGRMNLAPKRPQPYDVPGAP